ncbi:hypothetical protein H5410_048813 [Solanum commersonii]|uniref:Uncharacterized protein n=1 Tax=Solanum commersonii TaxID=4109 RepID=A0A9J5XJ95_SOLCO|nr:hypothetical protein H5410_048813 [Solanum commersonii]
MTCNISNQLIWLVSGQFFIILLSASFMMSENNDSHCRTRGGLSMSLSRPNVEHEVAAKTSKHSIGQECFDR